MSWRVGHAYYSTKDEQGHFELSPEFTDMSTVMQLDILSDLKADIEHEYEAAHQRFIAEFEARRAAALARQQEGK